MVGNSARWWFGLIGAVATVGLLVAACGGGAGPSPTATPPRAGPTATAAPATSAPLTLPPTPTPTAAPSPTSVPAGPPPKYGGTLNTTDRGTFPVWDTYNPRGAFSTHYVSNWLNNLFSVISFDASVLTPDLAEAWTVSQDGTLYSLRLRRGVQWHDGKPFTSADVLYNLNAAWKGTDPRTFPKRHFIQVKDIQAPDEFNVKITLQRPTASFLAALGAPYMMMYPAHIPNLEEWQKAPVGTGPFKFAALKPDIGVESLRNDKYSKKDEAGRPLPYLDGERFNFMTPETALAAFRAGRVDCGCGHDTDIASANFELLKKTVPDFTPHIFWGGQYLYFNNRPPFNDQRVRQAISAGIDRRKWAEAQNSGLNYFPPTPFAPPEIGGQWGLSKEEMLQVPGWRADRAKDVELSKRLIREAGVNPASVKLDFLGSSFYPEAATVADGLLREVGFTPNLLMLSSLDSTQRQVRADFDIVHQVSAIPFDDPSEYGGRWLLTGAVENYGKWSNAEIDQLFLSVDTTLDPGKRRALALELQRKILDWAVLVPLGTPARVNSTRGWVKGFFRPPGLQLSVAARFEKVWLDR